MAAKTFANSHCGAPTSPKNSSPQLVSRAASPPRPLQSSCRAIRRSPPIRAPARPPLPARPLQRVVVLLLSGIRLLCPSRVADARQLRLFPAAGGLRIWPSARLARTPRCPVPAGLGVPRGRPALPAHLPCGRRPPVLAVRRSWRVRLSAHPVRPAPSCSTAPPFCGGACRPCSEQQSSSKQHM